MSRDVFTQESADYTRIAEAIRYLESNFKAQPSLDDIARHVHLSKYHFDRMFKRWAGISPMQFLQYITLDYTRQKLVESASVLDTALDAGLSGPSRLYDLFVTFEAMTPGEYKRQADGVEIVYGFGATPFGECLLGMTEHGICFLGFIKDGKRAEAYDQLCQTWPGAVLTENLETVRPVVARIFTPDHNKKNQPFNLLLKGTNFQIRVWQALLHVPEGWMVSYQDIASYIGHPKAFRAVANAIAVNPVSYLIPCHRVITKSGRIHKYRWGAARKKALIGREAARAV